MQHKMNIKWVGIVALLGVALALGACSSGPSQADYDALKKQLGDAQTQSTSLQQQLQAAQAKAANQTVILGAVPNAPAPANPPAPPPPPPPMPDSAKAPVAYAFYVDTVTSAPGESPFHVDPTVACVQTNLFKRGMRIIWRFTVTDAATGKRVTGDDASSAVVHLPTGQDIQAFFAADGPPNVSDSWYWHGVWDVPMDYPLGTVAFTINVKTKGGQTATFKQLPVPPANLTIVN